MFGFAVAVSNVSDPLLTGVSEALLVVTAKAPAGTINASNRQDCIIVNDERAISVANAKYECTGCTVGRFVARPLQTGIDDSDRIHPNREGNFSPSS